MAAFALVLGLPLTWRYGGARTFGYIAGAGGLAVVLVYLAVNIAVIRAFRTEFRAEFRLGRHLRTVRDNSSGHYSERAASSSPNARLPGLGRSARTGRARPAVRPGQIASIRITSAVRVRWGGMARPISASAAPDTSMSGLRASVRPTRRGSRVPGVASVTR